MSNKILVNTPEYRKLNLDNHFLFLGSCFSDNVSARFRELNLKVDSNPFGTLFNPISICDLIQAAIKNESLDAFLFQNKDVWLNWKLNSKVFGLSEEEMSIKVSRLLSGFKENLQSCSHLFLTFGTAHYYRLKSNQESVSSCHKMPSSLFEKCFMNNVEDFEYVKSTIQLLKKVNPKISVMFTISPVRYLRDGLIESFASKARLRELITDLLSIEGASYFPAYEIVIDELRDYKYFTADGVHPNVEAVSYVFDKFSEATFSEELLSYSIERKNLMSRQGHVHLHAGSKDSVLFDEKTRALIGDFNLRYPQNKL